jgi:hypothetical protein
MLPYVEAETGIGYQLGSGCFLPTFHFDYDEIDSMLIGLMLIHPLLKMNHCLKQLKEYCLKSH